MRRVYQFVPGLSVGDAVSNYTLDLYAMLRDLGCETWIYSDLLHTSKDLMEQCTDYRAYTDNAEPGDILLYHYAVGSPVSEYVSRQPGKKILVYHNITPAHYFEKMDPQRSRVLQEGRDALKTLVPYITLALGVSDYNRKELEEVGFCQTEVLPLHLDLQRFNMTADKEVFERNRDVMSIISVGRIAPNKRLEETIRVFYFLKKTAYPLARLFLIGSFGGMRAYHRYLLEFAKRLDLLPEVVFPGHVSNEKLKAYYQIASAYLCTSEHEGFCLPLLESMYFNVPVFAYSHAAIPETMGGHGVLLHERRPEYVAQIIAETFQDEGLIQKICMHQQERWKIFTKERVAHTLKKYLDSLFV